MSITRTDSNFTAESTVVKTQCRFFVTRKKRLCRMTVKPGREYCGEHEPESKKNDGQEDKRIPCPNDPKHTCFVSKLESHLAICNARQTEQPPYIVWNINAQMAMDTAPRIPLNQMSKEILNQVINKVNLLYDKHLKDKIETVEEKPIHSAVFEEFAKSDRTESSRRHLRQASSLLWLMEEEGLVGDDTCYVELGAGKGQVSYYAWRAWCGAGEGRVALVDRASPRHKREGRLRGRGAARVRADLAHLALARLPPVAASGALVGLAKHLCGVATDYALRCLTAESALQKARGLALATCCHHRCEYACFVGLRQLQELGIDAEEFNVMLGIVSWATCGDGRSRDARNKTKSSEDVERTNGEGFGSKDRPPSAGVEEPVPVDRLEKDDTVEIEEQDGVLFTSHAMSQECRQEIGRRAKLLLDWGRVLFLKEKGFEARLCFFVAPTVSLENVCIIAKKVESR